MCDPRILIRIKNMHLHQWHGPIDRWIPYITRSMPQIMG